MFKKLFVLFLTVSPYIVASQTVNGIVYDAESTVKGIKVLNITQKILTSTNDKGEFQLKAKIKDTIFFESLFHEPKYVIVNKDYFESTYVFEVKKAVNELGEVVVKNQPKTKEFEEESFNRTLKDVIELDKKKEPQKYTAAPKYGADLVQLIGLVGKLFKKKKVPEPKKISYNQLVKLFETNTFFNQNLLVNDLKIEKELQPLYFEFCEAKEIEERLLNYNSRVQLLDLFIKYSDEFLLVIEMAKDKN
ncbi:hypothetical protein [Winogradskyella immobilis]|uniref:CarboxypepD_reg-like domain-containing protein n=1 Tax=Winogradskyella immobilis TaxID=2816852 RepID=A0ABS8ELA0_9FLAO|nr:hypothetical protein [Winogradskyella immobilis]MCC1483622.1 hypothetical protein [Winogradskyella immobilis]MCG0015716.1 hypothetical protein [Winogradskyella immobilis]